MSTPLTLEDLNMTSAEMAELLTGAQTYLAPQPDPADSESLTDSLTQETISEP